MSDGGAPTEGDESPDAEALDDTARIDDEAPDDDRHDPGASIGSDTPEDLADGGGTGGEGFEQDGPETTMGEDRPDTDRAANSVSPDAVEEGEEWRFSLADIEERQAEAEAQAEEAQRRREPIEPGDPSLEGAAFVLLGVFFTLYVLSRLVVG